MGDSRGRWEGDTLVVETTNTDKTNFRGSSEHLRLTERFTRTGPDEITYEFRVEDEASAPRGPGLRGCHEADPRPPVNTPVPRRQLRSGRILSGARADEKPQPRRKDRSDRRAYALDACNKAPDGVAFGHTFVPYKWPLRICRRAFHPARGSRRFVPRQYPE